MIICAFGYRGTRQFMIRIVESILLRKKLKSNLRERRFFQGVFIIVGVTESGKTLCYALQVVGKKNSVNTDY